MIKLAAVALNLTLLSWGIYLLTRFGLPKGSEEVVLVGLVFSTPMVTLALFFLERAPSTNEPSLLKLEIQARKARLKKDIQNSEREEPR